MRYGGEGTGHLDPGDLDPEYAQWQTQRTKSPKRGKSSGRRGAKRFLNSQQRCNLTARGLEAIESGRILTTTRRSLPARNHGPARATARGTLHTAIRECGCCHQYESEPADSPNPPRSPLPASPEERVESLQTPYLPLARDRTNVGFVTSKQW